MEQPFTKTGYFDLQALAAFSCCSVRWLRDRLADGTHPLPYHRVEGKLLVKREDFDRWIDHYRDANGLENSTGWWMRCCKVCLLPKTGLDRRFSITYSIE
jgi:hypothetical protein